MVAKRRRVFRLRVADARDWPRANIFDVLFLDVSHQSAVPGPLLKPFSGWKALITQTPETKTGADHGVTVYTYRTPYWFDGVKMAAAMLFPGGVAVKPFEAEKAIFHSNRTGAAKSFSRHHGRYILFAAADVNMVGSPPFRVKQIRSTHRADSIDRLLS